jgi:gamma-glutamyltranspeptidase/glutathione hydrolase
VADSDGTTVVLIHSLFNEFGSRELAGRTGVVLNDRLANVVVDGSQPVGGRRPVHTLNAYMVLDGGSPRLAGATPGGRGQVQTNFQVVSAVVDHGLDMQAAVDFPRWLAGTPRSPVPDHVVHLEQRFPADLAPALRRRGHEVRVAAPSDDDLFGSCTVVGREPSTGALLAAADARRGAVAVGR